MPKDLRDVKVLKRSGFDKSFRNTLTGTCGTLVPILVDEWCPDSKPYLKINMATALPPLVSDTYMNVRVRVEAFAVPERLCIGNYEDFYNDYASQYISTFSGGYPATSDKRGAIPTMTVGVVPNTGQDANIAAWNNYMISIGIRNNGTLLDYMGAPSATGSLAFSYVLNPMPFIAYHLIWQEWYRNPRVQKPAFAPIDTTSPVAFGMVSDRSTYYPVAAAPYARFYYGANNTNPVVGCFPNQSAAPTNYYSLVDGVSILSLRQRNFGLDFFTAALVEPQQGDMTYVVVPSSDMPSGVNGFTIGALRSANSLQQFRERNGLTSPRYQQQLYARYGVAPSDGVIQRPILLGAATYDVYSHGVTATANNDSSPVGGSPFAGALGQRAGNAFAAGSDFLIEGFHAKEPMYVIVLASLVPEVSYSQNFAPYLHRYNGFGSITDLANGILQNVGPQAILERDIYAVGNSTNVFAYTDRYSDWMIKNNEIHGEFKYGATLASFVAQRHFAQIPQFGSSFLTIPTDYLDDVMQYDTATLGFTYWMDIAFDYKVSMPLQEYAIPSLQDPGYEHGKTIKLKKNGQLL